MDVYTSSTRNQFLMWKHLRQYLRQLINFYYTKILDNNNWYNKPISDSKHLKQILDNNEYYDEWT